MEADILEELYREHYSAAMLYCLALCGDEQLAQDLTADAFVKAYLSLPDRIPSFRWWLLAVCRNLWMDYLRKNKRLVGSDSLEHLSSTQTPEKEYLTKERSQALWRAVQSLEGVDRELVTAFYFSGVPLYQLAQLMGISYSAARQRLVRLRRKLKQKMEELGYGI